MISDHSASQGQINMSKRSGPSTLLAPFRVPPIFISVDLDSWVHSRWASGAEGFSLWSSSFDGYQKIYGMRQPGQDFDAAIETTMALLDEHKLKITFFVLSEIAELYPDLMRRLDEQGHEIALHGKHGLFRTKIGDKLLAVNMGTIGRGNVLCRD